MLRRIRSCDGVTVAVRCFRQYGAFIWGEPILAPYSAFPNWHWLQHAPITLFGEWPLSSSHLPMRIPRPFFDTLSQLFQATEWPVRKWDVGVSNPSLRRISAHTSARRWHTDANESITLVIPLHDWSLRSGGTRLILGSHLRYRSLTPSRYLTVANKMRRIWKGDESVVFSGAAYCPLVMDGQIMHSPGDNSTDVDRDAIVLQIDRIGVDKAIVQPVCSEWVSW